MFPVGETESALGRVREAEARARRETSAPAAARAEACAERSRRGGLATRARPPRAGRGKLDPHTRYYHLPDTIPMHPFSAEHLRGFSRVDGLEPP